MGQFCAFVIDESQHALHVGSRRSRFFVVKMRHQNPLQAEGHNRHQPSKGQEYNAENFPAKIQKSPCRKRTMRVQVGKLTTAMMVAMLRLPRCFDAQRYTDYTVSVVEHTPATRVMLSRVELRVVMVS